MSKVFNIIKNVLNEGAEKTLKLFYDIKIYINQPEAAAPAPVPTETIPVETAAPMENVPAAESVKYDDLDILNEEVINLNKNGSIAISQNEAESIQTIEDMLDFVGDSEILKAKKVENIFDELSSEIVKLAVSGTPAGGVIKKEDKIMISLDYGLDKTDSVGVKILKRVGIEAVSVMLKKDGKVLPGKFNLEELNKQILMYSNSI